MFNQQQTQNRWQDYLMALGLIVVFFSGIIIFWQIIIKPQSPQSPSPQATSTQPTIKPMVSCSPDILSYGQTTQNVKLIPNRITMFAADGKFINPQVIVAKSETETSKVACGYLFVRSGTKTNGALQNWEDVYINPNTFGGHLYKDSTFSINDGQQYSEYLYSLNKIQYWPTSARRTVSTADWAALLNVSNNINFSVALNTNDKTGFIDEISIAYKCWDPATGYENTGCKLIVQSTSTNQTIAPVK